MDIRLLFRFMLFFFDDCGDAMHDLFFLDCLGFDWFLMRNIALFGVVRRIIRENTIISNSNRFLLWSTFWHANSLWSLILIIRRTFILLAVFIWWRSIFTFIKIFFYTLMELYGFRSSCSDSIAVYRTFSLRISGITISGFTSLWLLRNFTILTFEKTFRTASLRTDCSTLLHFYNFCLVELIWWHIRVFILLWNWLFDFWLFWIFLDFIYFRFL